MWWVGEFVPKLVYDAATGRRRLAIGLGRHRQLRAGERIDRSVIARLRETSYEPPNLSDGFVVAMRELPAMPDDSASAV